MTTLYQILKKSNLVTERDIIIIIYRLRTFNSSMWGSLRIAPIIFAVSDRRQVELSFNMVSASVHILLVFSLTVTQVHVEGKIVLASY